MNGFLYGIALQWRLDIRSRALLVTCYLVPLAFFLLMAGIFTSVMARNEKYADTIHDCDERFHGGVYRAAALFGRNLWQRCEKGL